jgi:hypothetical protein
LDFFAEESDPMKKILAEHPDVLKSVETHKTAEEFFNNLKNIRNIGLGSAAVGGGIYGVKTLKDLIGSLSEIGD